MKVGEGVAGWVVEHGETLLVPEAGDDPRVAQEHGAQPNTVRSVIALPLRGARERTRYRDIQSARRPAHRLHNRLSAYSGRPRGYRNRECARCGLHSAIDHHRRLHHAVQRALSLRGAEPGAGAERAAGLPVSMAFLDLDHFKMVNDAHGHLVGSELLGAWAAAAGVDRKQDWCFRYGGDEFVVLMPETGEDEAMALSTKLLRGLMDTEFNMKNGQKLWVSASVGVATAPIDDTTVHGVIGVADMRMYAVKARGRGAVRGRRRGR